MSETIVVTVGADMFADAVAEHQVEQDDAGPRVGRGAGDLLVAQGRVDHRVGAALGERVVAEVDHRVVVDQQVVAQGEVV